MTEKRPRRYGMGVDRLGNFTFTVKQEETEGVTYTCNGDFGENSRGGE